MHLLSDEISDRLARKHIANGKKKALLGNPYDKQKPDPFSRCTEATKWPHQFALTLWNKSQSAWTGRISNPFLLNGLFRTGWANATKGPPQPGPTKI